MMMLRRTVVVLALVAVGLAGPAATAWAHNTVDSTSPHDSARLARAPERIAVRFDQPVGVKYNAVVVTGPNGGQWQDGEPKASGKTLVQQLRPLGPTGRYQVSWRALSADGHPVTGSFNFTMTEKGEGTPLPPSQEAGSAQSGQEDAANADDSGPSWPFLAGGLVLAVLAVVAVALWLLARFGARRTPQGQARENDWLGSAEEDAAESERDAEEPPQSPDPPENNRNG